MRTPRRGGVWGGAAMPGLLGAIWLMAGIGSAAAQSVRPAGGQTTTPQGQTSTAAAAEVRTVNDGVYTAAQADRGQQAFTVSCALCHNVTDFGGPGYLQLLSGTSVRVLHQIIATTMPQNAAGTLTDQQYTDIVSHILRAGGYPTGQRELPVALAELDGIKIVPARGD